MVNCRYLFRRSKITKIEVQKKSLEQGQLCKEQLENVVTCWRNSGIDSRNCLGLVTTLAACIASSNIIPKKGFIGGKMVRKPTDNCQSAARTAIDQLNRTIGKYLHRQ